eukprot:752939-Hanusia_phi.AAC.1
MLSVSLSPSSEVARAGRRWPGITGLAVPLVCSPGCTTTPGITTHLHPSYLPSNPTSPPNRTRAPPASGKEEGSQRSPRQSEEEGSQRRREVRGGG